MSGRVDTRFYSQQAARCKGSPRAVLSAVQSNANRQGYEVLFRQGLLLARNGTTEVTVLALRSDSRSAASATSLLYLQLNLPERAR